MAVIVAVGVNTDGRREVLGMEIGTSETEPILNGGPAQGGAALGHRGVKLVVYDAYEGIKAVVAQ